MPHAQPQFTHPTFKIHQSVTRFCLPLSRFASLPSNKGKKLVVGALIFHPSPEGDSRGKVLLVHRAEAEEAYPNHWEIPGGGAELGIDQTLLESVVREVKEETGLRVAAIKGEFGSSEWESERVKGRTYKRYNFIVEVDPLEDEGVKLSDEEHQAYRWIGVDDDISGLTMTADQVRVVREGIEILRKRIESEGKQAKDNTKVVDSSIAQAQPK